MKTLLQKRKQDRRTRAIYKVILESYPLTSTNIDDVIYLCNPSVIQLRVIDPIFKGMGHQQRIDSVLEKLSHLSESTTEDIMMLLALTPEEHELGTNPVERDFDNPD
jgi:hypothetical protein